MLLNLVSSRAFAAWPRSLFIALRAMLRLMAQG